jgi:hypothetical protein
MRPKSFSVGENRSVGHLGTGLLEVEVVTLDSLYAKYGPPDVVKIDVEGAEYSALLGAKCCLDAKPTIFLATHSTSLSDQCDLVLSSAGYARTGISEDESRFTCP